jgi:alpha-tubulin suppressor-like RCC1 family protein
MSRARSWAFGCLVLAGVLACHDEPTAPAVSRTSETAQALTRVPLQFLQVSTGSSKGCGVTTDYRAYCWRVSKWTNVSDQPFVAYPVPGGISFRQVSVGKSDDHFCGVTTTNLAYCWGNNDLGQLGDGTFLNSAAPVLVAGGRRFESITAGYKFTCAKNGYNRVFCWGDNTYGEIGNENQGNPPTPERVHSPETFSVVNAGLEHVCGVTTDARAYCWGRDLENQLGDGTTAHRSDSLPTAVAGSRLYKQIDAGVDHSCALSTAGVAFCWGAGAAIGDGKTQDRAVPTRVAGGLTFTQLSTGWDHTCALTSDRQTYCWGGFITGQVNGSAPVSSLVPVAVMTDYPFTQISIGEHLTCGIRANGATWCWGLGWSEDGRAHLIHALM